MEPKLIKQTVYFGLFILAVVFGVVLLWPFLRIIVLSAAFAFVFSPVNRWFLKYCTRGNRWFSALLTIAVFIVIVCGPLVLIGSSVFEQAQAMYHLLVDGSGTNEVIDRINTLVHKYFPWAPFDVRIHLANIAQVVTSSLGSVAGFVLSTIFSLLLFVLSLFYFLEDGQRWRKTITRNSPLSHESTEKILTRLSHAVEGVVKGYLLIAVIQGVLLGLGLWLFGVPNPALWGLLAGVTSLVPTVGTSLVSIPAIVYLFAMGEVGGAVGLAVWAGVLVGFIDNLLSPVVVGRKIDIHPMFILFSVLGGIALMGPAGILIGPLVVSFIYALTSVYSDEMKTT